MRVPGPLLSSLALLVLFAPLSGCLWMTKKDGLVMQQRIAALEQQLAESAKKTTQLQADVDDRIKRMDDAVNRATLVIERNSADLGLTVEKVQAQLGQVEGRLEDLSHGSDALARRFDDYRASSDTRLEQLTNQAKAAEAPPIPDTADALYAEAEKRYAAKQWKDARRLLEAFANRYPQDARAPRAQFLLGDGYAAEERFANAIGVWRTLLDLHPPPEVAEDTMYKSGLAFAALKYCGDARVFFQELLRRYPHTKWKADARQQLQELAKLRTNKERCSS